MKQKTQKKFVSMSFKLMLWLGSLITLILAIISVVGYFESKSNTYSLLQELQKKAMVDVAQTFKSYEMGKGQTIKVLAEEIVNRPNITQEEILSLVKAFEKADDFELVYVGLEDSGLNYQSDGEILGMAQNYDTRNRPWYKEAKAAQDFIITEPYKSASSGNVGVTYAMPIIRNGQFIGVVGGDYDLARFSRDVLALGHTDNSYVGVYAPDGTILLHEDEKRILTKNALSKNISTTLKEQPELLEAENLDSIFYAKDDKNISYAVMCDKLNANFRVCSITQESAYTDAVNEVLMLQGLGGAIAVILSLILIKIVITIALKPLSSIQNGLSGFFSYLNHESKNAPKPILVKSKDEFGIMA
ncbi:cache domain-containing protein, partial [Helicobacter burdigaliensis]|uniref:cache domain-containing protein n=2 Tax=Helicobacter burdigaliensis TaxID=2315334 RepID=UPI0039E83BBB